MVFLVVSLVLRVRCDRFIDIEILLDVFVDCFDVEGVKEEL